jgi:hypothetical protein
MTDVDDGYGSYYAERLWQLLPAVYRATDTDSLVGSGPLRELLNRIGDQVAVVRRSIDQLWADQSIETCQDWVIPYIGELLGTNLVSNLNPRGQRLDVAKTIHYRRHKGTLQVLEELAVDVTGWTGVVVEGLQRISRARHGLDPAVGPRAFAGAAAADVATLLATGGITGLLTGTPAGGLADLRNAHGSALAGGPFDEFFHSADVRRGQGAIGHFGIAKLLVFAWRLRSFPVVGGTPVAIAGTADQFVFDPTGRQVPLFMPPAPAFDDFSQSWTPAQEWQVPGPLTASLDAVLSGAGGSGTALPPAPAYPDTTPPTRYVVDGAPLAHVWPENGIFQTASAPTAPLTVDYQYGFASTIGAGPYDRDPLGDPPAVVAPEQTVRGGSGLDAALTEVGATGTVTIADSLTYTTLGVPAAPVASLLVRAGPAQRPVLRPPAGGAPWIFTGGPGAQLTLDGLTVSGCDIVLRGTFDTVRLTACTIDPGTAGPGAPPLAIAADGRPLAPSTIYVESDPAAPADQAGSIETLLVDHCVVGPIRTRFGGAVQTLSATDSIVQGLPAQSGLAVFDPALLAAGLLAGRLSPTSTTAGFLPSAAILADNPPLQAGLQAYLAQSPSDQRSGLPAAVLTALQHTLDGTSFFNAGRFAAVDLSPEVESLSRTPGLDAATRGALNLGLLQDCYPVALAPAALALAGAKLQLSRVTVLGRIAAEQLWGSDSILAGFTTVSDTQQGCLRFSAWSSGSVVPRAYESVTIAPRAPIFTSDTYGEPGYGQLLETADAAIADGGTGSVSTGAETGAEMGAFSADLNPLREQGLLVKYAEYMPLGLAPVIIHVT